MANLVVAKRNLLSTVATNQLGATVVVGFTAYMTGCILAFEENKSEMLRELYGAAFVTWKWYMGFGPEPKVNTGIPDEVQGSKALKGG